MADAILFKVEYGVHLFGTSSGKLEASLGNMVSTSGPSGTIDLSDPCVSAAAGEVPAFAHSPMRSSPLMGPRPARTSPCASCPDPKNVNPLRRCHAQLLHRPDAQLKLLVISAYVLYSMRV
ncbi:hypothetical protein BC827DRAFT_1248453 [Russula dissimulans]|nr:hypothetical protein BC827DRAFT_1248453 [Russula dissimulans]